MRFELTLHLSFVFNCFTNYINNSNFIILLYIFQIKNQTKQKNKKDISLLIFNFEEIYNIIFIISYTL